jgi:exosortase A-associated hydrolase 2
LLGCGDSSGDFGDATWEAWLTDVEFACDWLQQRFAAPLWLWGQRSGCLLANEAANRMARPVNLLVLAARAFPASCILQQFLRLRLAGEMTRRRKQGGHGGIARSNCDRAQPVEVAGYLLSANARRATWRRLSCCCRTVPGVSNGSRSPAIAPMASLSPAAAARLTQWQAAGQDVRGTVVSGPAFWQTSEISECRSAARKRACTAMQRDACAS